MNSMTTYQRLQPVETECDQCGEPILPSENRTEMPDGSIICDECLRIAGERIQNIR